MERQVTFRDRQEQQAADHNNLQAFVRESIDDLVADAVTSGKAYAGLAVTETTVTSVTVAPGRLYSGGLRYVLETPAAVDLFSQLPLVLSKVVAIVAWGAVADIDVQPRDYLINADTRQTEPRAVSMENRRTVNLQAVGGVEASDPARPTLDVAVTPIAWVLMSPTGIVTITPDPGRVPNLADQEARITTVEAFDAVTGPALSTLTTDLAKLASALNGLASARDLTQAFADIARLKTLSNLPADFADYSADEFLTYDTSDLTDLTFLATVNEGVRFSPEAQAYTALQIFSALDPLAKVSTDGLLLPAYVLLKRLASVAQTSTLNISQYGYQTVSLVQQFMTRYRIRYGVEWVPSSDVDFWRRGHDDPNWHIFRRQDDDDDNWKEWGGPYSRFTHDEQCERHYFKRIVVCWEDSYQVPYWTYVTTAHSVTGAQVAQSWLNAHDGWLTQIGLHFGAIAATGDVTVTIVTLTDSGTPDVNAAIQHVNLPRASMVANGVTLLPIPPTFLAAGTRYAMILTTQAAHFMGVGASSPTIEGTFFYSTDGAYFAGDLTKALCIDLFFASFTNSRSSITLNALSLSGGIASVDIIAEAVTPPSTVATYEIQIGGVWIALSALTPAALVGLPPLLPLRVTFQGTSDIQPGIRLAGSEVSISRPRTTFKHLSTAREPAGAATTIKVIAKLENWNPTATDSFHTVAGHHALTCTILPDGASANSSPVVADEWIDATTAIRTFTFTMGAPTSDFRIEMDGSTTTALDVFLVAERVDVEL